MIKSKTRSEKKQSDDTKEKIRQKALLRNQDPLYRKKLSDSAKIASKKRWENPEYRENQILSLQNATRTYVRTKEHQEKINKGLKGKKAWNEGFGDYVMGEKNPMFGKTAWSNGLTKETHPSLQRISDKLKGDQCYLWKDGRSFKEYSRTFYDIREIIKKRDDYKCRMCNKIEILIQKEDSLNRGLVIHHIDENKLNNDESNLLSLCRSCHKKIHNNIMSNNKKIKDDALSSTDR